MRLAGRLVVVFVLCLFASCSTSSVSGSDAAVSSLAITGFDLHGASIADLAGNHATAINPATTFPGLSINPHGLDSPPYLADYHLV